MSYFFRREPVEPGLLKELKERQYELAKQVIIQKPDFKLKLLAGCDSSFLDPDTILSVFVLLTYPELEEVERIWHVGKVELPYVPGFLAFREAPNLIKAYEKLQQKPDLIMVDGHGIAHPRGLGIASQLGVLLNKPTMGVAKKVLCGKYEEPAPEKGNITPLIYKDEKIADVLRTKLNVKPVFISPGHLMDQQTATEIALATAIKYRLPEPTRLADHYAAVLKKEVRE